MSFTPPSGPSYGLRSPYVFAGYKPIVSQRAPTANDLAAIGQTWIDVPNQDSYTLVAIVANAAVWLNTAGGAGLFANLTVTPGPTALTGQFTVTSGAGLPVSIGADATDHNVSIGSATGVSTMSLQGGTGGITASTSATGFITLGSAAMTGTITLGLSTAGQTINIGNGVNTGAQIVNIANGASGANSTVNILSGVGTAGAGVLALGNNTRVTTIGLGNIAPAAARTITIAGGNSAQNDTVNILAGDPSANAQDVNILTGTATGGTQSFTLGGSAMTGNIILGRSASGQAVSISGAINTGAQSVSIASGANAAASTVNIANGAATAGAQAVNIMGGALGGTSTGTVNIANGTAGVNLDVNILSGVGTAGAATLIMANNTRVTTVDLGNVAPAAARTFNIAGGDSAQANTINVLNGNPSAGAQIINMLSGTVAAGATADIRIGNGANAGAQTVNIANGASAANSDVNILSGVGTAGAATLALGNNTRVTTIGLGNIAPAAARVITIAGGNSAQNDTVAILNGNPSANAQTVSILSGTPTGGTQVLNLGAQTTNPIAINMGSGTGLATVQIANGAAANVVTIGSNTGAAQTSIQGGTAGISVAGAAAAPITIGNAAQTAAINIANSTGALTTGLMNGVNAAAQVLNVASATPAGDVTINVLTSAASAGTQAFNLFGTGATRAGTIAIGTGAAAHQVTLGSTNGAAKTTINSGTASMDLTMAAAAVGAGGILVTQGGVPFRILCGAGAPNNNLAIQAGDLYIRSNPGAANERIYVATAAGAWTNVTCAA